MMTPGLLPIIFKIPQNSEEIFNYTAIFLMLTLPSVPVSEDPVRSAAYLTKTIRVRN